MLNCVRSACVCVCVSNAHSFSQDDPANDEEEREGHSNA